MAAGSEIDHERWGLFILGVGNTGELTVSWLSQRDTVDRKPGSPPRDAIPPHSDVILYCTGSVVLLYSATYFSRKSLVSSACIITPTAATTRPHMA